MSAYRRLLWWNPVVQHGGSDTSAKIAGDGGPLLEASQAGGFVNLVSSLCSDGMHRAALDVDIAAGPPAIAAIGALRDLIGRTSVFMSRNGRCHAFGDAAFPWPEYLEVLRQCEAWGMLDNAYVNHCVDRGQSLIRIPSTPPIAVWFNRGV